MSFVKLKFNETFVFDTNKGSFNKFIKCFLIPANRIVIMFRYAIQLFLIISLYFLILLSSLYDSTNISYYLKNYDHKLFKYLFNSQLFNFIYNIIDYAFYKLIKYAKMLDSYVNFDSKFTTFCDYSLFIKTPDEYKNLQIGTKITDFSNLKITFPEKEKRIESMSTAYGDKYKNLKYWDYACEFIDAVICENNNMRM